MPKRRYIPQVRKKVGKNPTKKIISSPEIMVIAFDMNIAVNLPHLHRRRYYIARSN